MSCDSWCWSDSRLCNANDWYLVSISNWHSVTFQMIVDSTNMLSWIKPFLINLGLRFDYIFSVFGFFLSLLQQLISEFVVKQITFTNFYFLSVGS
jgi:hypothetical protein